MALRVRRIWAWTAAFAWAAAGCSGSPPPVPTGPVQSYALRQAQRGVQVALDPFFTEARTRDAFTGGDEFPARGVLPVHVILENGSAGAVQPDPLGAILFRPDGRVPAMSPEDAFALVKLQVGWWAIGAGLLGGAAPGYRNEARSRDLRERALPDKPVANGAAAKGFLYFSIPSDISNLAGSWVRLPVRLASGDEIAFEIPLEGRRDVPGQSGQSGQAGAAAPAPAAPQPVIKTNEGTRVEGTGGKGIIIRSAPMKP
ncbi:MAG TPA: hypothetical protein VMG58_14595 [Candidatus Sulfotelmatobacter sp.]|nr:hypothetical protein [Candidatus Sulfotelmatobacter sp.]